MGNHRLGEEILINVTIQDHHCSFSGGWQNLATLYGMQKRHEEVSSYIIL